MKQLITIVFLFNCLMMSAQTWIPKADFGGIGRHRGSGFSIGNKGYIGIGHMNGSGVNIVYQDWWQYDPASNSWTQKADYANGVPNYAAIAFATSTKGYIGGGTAFASNFFEYDPEMNTWTAIANCPEAVGNQTAFSINEKGYVISSNLLIEYNPANDQWTYKQSLPVICDIWSSSFVIGGSAFLKTGTSLFEYKASQDLWISRASCPGLSTGGSSAFAIYGKGYLVSGYAGSLSNVNKEVWEFNPATNLWTQKGDFEGSGRRFSVGFSINNRGYLGIGTNGINFNDFWSFDHYVGTSTNDPLTVSCTTFPNPATSAVHFQLSEAMGSDNWTLQIINEFGQIIRKSTETGHEAQIERGDLPAGTYYFQIEQPENYTPLTGAFQLIDL